MDISWQQLATLSLLAAAIACVSWTVTREEIFRELRDYCAERSRTSRRLLVRKLFYIATCEYCFSHWVALAFKLMTGYRLLLDDWRGDVIGFFALVAVANVYLSAYARLRVDIKAERVQIAAVEKEIEDSERERDDVTAAGRRGLSARGSTMRQKPGRVS